MIICVNYNGMKTFR